MTATALHEFLTRAARRFPDRIAVVEPGCGTITYAELERLSDGVRDVLINRGIRRGDRVGFALRKSIDTVAVIYGILKAGAAYVPVDPGSPAARCAFIMADCTVSALILEARFGSGICRELAALDAAPSTLILEAAGGGVPLSAALSPRAPVRQSAISAPDDIAYILYTSGSTGKPKGVMLSHENAVSFVDWCSGVLEPTPDDRFSSHAPFHFDLSILDLHVAIKHGATLVLVAEDIGKDPAHLAALIADQRITIWYSAPSILALLAQFTNLSVFDYSALRHVLFAGEVFPVKHLRALTKQWPHPRYFNLYGPTETNVCTFHEVALPVPEQRSTPYPIGEVCSHLRGKVVNENGNAVTAGAEGELVISGRGVMHGYWNLPEQTQRSFLLDPDGTRWYRTGDIVVEGPPGSYIYRGRRDRMVKRRGYRVELGEIESGLYKHPAIKEAAVVAIPNEEAGVSITAFLSGKDGGSLSLIALKRFCAEHLPLYMIPDRFSWHESLPKTSTDKIDYQRLKEMT